MGSLQKVDTGHARAIIDGIAVTDFRDQHALFERIGRLASGPTQSLVCYLNIHVANLAHSCPELKRVLQEADLVYCDGAGIALSARVRGQRLSRRHTAADWFWDFLHYTAKHGLNVYLLGSRAEVAGIMPGLIDCEVAGHSVVGVHHGYMTEDAALEQHVVAAINAAAPDILMVGLGTPLQELWIDRHRHHLKTPVICAMGACLDFASGLARRCPRFIGECGFEWAYRFYREPRRLFRRYAIGNLWFFGRLGVSLSKEAVRRIFFRPPPHGSGRSRHTPIRS